MDSFHVLLHNRKYSRKEKGYHKSVKLQKSELHFYSFVKETPVMSTWRSSCSIQACLPLLVNMGSCVEADRTDAANARRGVSRATTTWLRISRSAQSTHVGRTTAANVVKVNGETGSSCAGDRQKKSHVISTARFHAPMPGPMSTKTREQPSFSALALANQRKTPFNSKTLSEDSYLLYLGGMLIDSAKENPSKLGCPGKKKTRPGVLEAGSLLAGPSLVASSVMSWTSAWVRGVTLDKQP